MNRDNYETRDTSSEDVVHRQKEEFLLEYEALCRKHKIIITSCGCCDSPWLKTAEQSSDDLQKSLDDNFKHLRTT